MRSASCRPRISYNSMGRCNGCRRRRSQELPWRSSCLSRHRAAGWRSGASTKASCPASRRSRPPEQAAKKRIPDAGSSLSGSSTLAPAGPNRLSASVNLYRGDGCSQPSPHTISDPSLPSTLPFAKRLNSQSSMFQFPGHKLFLALPEFDRGQSVCHRVCGIEGKGERKRGGMSV